MLAGTEKKGITVISPDGVYDQIVLLFDADQTGSGERWLFDDITGPKRDAPPRSSPAMRATPSSRTRGGVWFGEVFEHEGMLYLYYEAWGCEGAVPDRDTPYFGGGHSATGCASASKEAFLTWCGLE